MIKERDMILVIEDDKGIVEVLKAIFRIHNIEATFADNGRKGLDIICNNPVSLIVCDFMLPDINGDQILQTIRKDESLKHIPFVFLSAFADPDDIRKGMEAGADAYITKPFSVSTLVTTIKTQLSIVI